MICPECGSTNVVKCADNMYTCKKCNYVFYNVDRVSCLPTLKKLDPKPVQSS